MKLNTKQCPICGKRVRHDQSQANPIVEINGEQVAILCHFGCWMDKKKNQPYRLDAELKQFPL